MKKTKKLVIGFCVAIFFGGTFILSLALMVSCSQKLPDAPISSNSVKEVMSRSQRKRLVGIILASMPPPYFFRAVVTWFSTKLPLKLVICPNGTATPIRPAPTNTFTPVPSLTALSNTPTITWSATITPSPNLTYMTPASSTCTECTTSPY